MKNRRLILTFGALAVLASAVSAQSYYDDDIYFDASKAPKQTSQPRQGYTQTYVTPNAVVVAAFIPVLAGVGTAIGVSPFAMMIATMLACNFAFMLPPATPPNAIAYGTGEITIKDLVTCGLGLKLIALVVFRIGWWATIYCQQILLGMLTVFGPLQWAFSLLPKWEGAWAKWLTRYLTVHFYGAMLYFVGFYVLLLFDIVLCIQVENLTAITASEQTMAAYLQNSFFSAGYLMAASIVALKCLNLVPDLAAWMIPEGDTAFSTRNFGEGVAQQAKMTATGAMGGIMR